MRAVIVHKFAPFETARLEQVADLTPARGEVVVNMQAIEMNFPDILVMEGNYQVKPPLPFAPGKAGAGTVVAVGADVDTVNPGDRVAVQVEYGAYAEQVCVEAAHCYAMPDAMPFDVAAALGLAYQTAYFALTERAAMQPNDTVLVLGPSGGVGSAAIQLAKALGAATVIAAGRGAKSEQVATSAGCDHFIDLNMDNLRDGLRAAVHALTNGKGVDIVIDPVGGVTNAAALRAMAWCGRLVVVGFAAGDIPVFKANYLLVKNISVSGLQWSDYRQRDPAQVRAAQVDMFDMWSNAKIAPFIGDRHALADFATAMATLKSGNAQGKSILIPEIKNDI